MRISEVHTAPSPPEIFVYVVVQDKFHTDVKTHTLAVFDADDGQLTNRVQVCTLMFRFRLMGPKF